MKTKNTPCMHPGTKRSAVVPIWIFLFSVTILLSSVPAQAQINSPYEFFQASLYTNAPITEGEDLVLAAFGGTAWEWSGPNSFYSNDSYIIIPGADTTYQGTYYLTITDDIYDTTTYFSTSVQITALGASPCILVTDYITCSFSEVQFNTSYTGSGLIYNWSSQPGTNVSFTPNNSVQDPLVTFGSTGLHTIKLVYTNTQTNVTDSCFVQINVIECCTQANVTLLDNTTLSSFLNSQTFSNPTVVIKGGFTIDQDFTMPANVSRLIILKGGHIDLMQDKYFVMDGVWVTGCDTMWQAINLLANSSLVLKNCRIHDGTYAIWAWPSNQKITLYDNSFINNNYSMVTFDTQPYFELSGNYFTSTSQGMLYPLSTLRPKAGITCLWNPLMTLLNIGNPNGFTYLQNGISVLNSNLTVYSNATYFSHISGGIGQGNAILGMFDPNTQWSGQYLLTKQGNTDPSIPVDFNDCQTGIYAKKINLRAEKNRFTGVHSGIIADQCKDKVVTIDKNNIQCRFQGIFLNHCDPAGSIDVTNNTIELLPYDNNPYQSACIKIDEATNAPNNYTLISANDLTVNTAGFFGVLSTLANRTVISENTIWMNDYQNNLAGIKLNACLGNEVTCNTITGPGYLLGNSATMLPIGMQIVATSGSRFSCNETDETYTGIGFEDNCAGTDFRGNKMHDHTTGLYYNPWATTGDQVYNGNKWLGNSNPNYPGYAAKNLNGTLSSLYYVRPSCPYCWPPSIWASFSWFNYNSIPGSNFDCEYISPPCTGSGSSSSMVLDTSLTNLDYAIASDSLVYAQYQQELTWVNQRYLYEKLHTNSQLAANDTLMQQFYSNTTALSPGQFQRVEHNTREGMAAGVLTAQYLDSLAHQMMDIMDSIGVLDSLLYAHPSYSDSLQYLSIKSSMTLSHHSLGQLSSIALQTLTTQRNQLMAVVSIENDNLSEQDVMQANEKAIRDIYLSTIAVGMGSFTFSQLETIRNIAFQCPLSGGPGVYLARSLYAMINDTLLNDKELCLQQGIIKSLPGAGRGYQETMIRFSIYPNPASSSVLLSWNLPLDKTAGVAIFNQLGSWVASYDISLQQQGTNLGIGNLLPGVYVLKIRIENQTVYTGKLIVIQ